MVKLEYDLALACAINRICDTRLSAPKNEQVRVFRDDTVNISLPFQETQLSIGLVWCNNVVHSFCSQCLDVSFL